MAKHNKRTAYNGNKDNRGNKGNQGNEGRKITGGANTAVSQTAAASSNVVVSSKLSGGSKGNRGTNKKGKNKLVLFLFPILVIALIVLIAVLNSQSNKVAQQEVKAVLSADSLAGQPILGSADAKVTVVEFGDYKCPACKQWSDSVFPKLKADFIDAGKVKFTFMQFPFISADSLTAAAASEAVAAQYPDQFWQFHEGIYHAQQAENIQWATPERLIDIAKETIPGVDEGKLAEQFADVTYNEQALKDKAVGEKAEIQGTPSVYVNGKPFLGGYLDYDSLKAFIEAELKASEQ